MYINQHYGQPADTGYVDGFAVRQGEAPKISRVLLLSEHILEIYVNDRLTMKLVCIAENLTELVLGRLLTEGIIKESGEVESLYLCESGRRAKVFLKDRRRAETGRAEKPFVETTLSCCTDNHILDHFYMDGEMEPLTPIPWRPEWIFRLAEEFEADTPLHQKTRSTHSCFLARQGTTLIRCEDIGRHNAMDKAIGYAMRQGVDLKETILYSSGRIPVDMAVKAIRAKVPVLVSKESPTLEAVEMAEKYGLTLICNAKHGRWIQFTMKVPDGSRE